MKVRAKKHLGQHFLKDESIAHKIVNALSVKDGHVLEIGPGTGVLTEKLMQKYAHLSVVEVDMESIDYLQQQYPDLTILHEDFLKLDFEKHFGNDEVAVIGNFPYHISSQILFKALEEKKQVPALVGMFQKEVAERVCATHGNKTYGILSVLCQVFYETEYLFTVHENVFQPPPKVKSGVLKMTRKEVIPRVKEKMLFELVKTAFNQRRKTLRNAWKRLDLPDTCVDEKILNLRAEQLTVENFVEICLKWQNDGSA